MTLAPAKPDANLAQLIKGRSVVLTGKLASMSRQDFVELVESYGGRVSLTLAAGTALIVVGQRSWPLHESGWLPETLRKARVMIKKGGARLKILPEEKFLAELGLESHRQLVSPQYTTQTLTELLGIARERIVAWVRAGLIKPASTENGVWHFDFRQVTAAKTLCELARRGVSSYRLRKSFEQLQTWMPEAQTPLQQLALVHNDGRMLVRLGDGDLAGFDGQLHFDFTEQPASVPMRIVAGPTSAQDWLQQGLDQEQAGYFADAEASYRQALRLSGPDAQACFNLANVLNAQGQKQSAIERFRQAVEIDPSFGDAWNNLGIALCDIEQREEACAAFQAALKAEPDNYLAHYNLADALEEIGRQEDAIPHWKAYLRHDSTSERGVYARQRCRRA